MGFTDIRVVGLKGVFFTCPGNHFKCSILIDLVNFPELVYHIMIGLSMLKRINLLRSQAWTAGAFRLMIDNLVSNSELYHLDLLSG